MYYIIVWCSVSVCRKKCALAVVVTEAQSHSTRRGIVDFTGCTARREISAEPIADWSDPSRSAKLRFMSRLRYLRSQP